MTIGRFFGAIRDYTLDEFNLDYICNGRHHPTGTDRHTQTDFTGTLRHADVHEDRKSVV